MSSVSKKKKETVKSEETSSVVDTSKVNERDPLVEEINESIVDEIAYHRFHNMIKEGQFDGLEQDKKIELIKEKSIYQNLVHKITSEQKKKSTKLITSIITKTITISGFYFAIIAFILTSDFVFNIDTFAIHWFFGSIIILFAVNCFLLPLIFLRTPLKSNSAEYISNANIVQSIIFLTILIVNLLLNTFSIENREMWFIIGVPGFIFILFLVLIWQVRISDSKGLEKELNYDKEKT